MIILIILIYINVNIIHIINNRTSQRGLTASKDQKIEKLNNLKNQTNTSKDRTTQELETTWQ